MFQKILIAVIAIDLFALSVYLIFIINVRIISQKEQKKRQLYLQLSYAAFYNSKNENAAKKLTMSVDEFIEKCKEFKIELPETRVEKIEQKKIESEKIEETIENPSEAKDWIQSLRSKAKTTDD